MGWNFSFEHLAPIAAATLATSAEVPLETRVDLAQGLEPLGGVSGILTAHAQHLAADAANPVNAAFDKVAPAVTAGIFTAAGLSLANKVMGKPTSALAYLPAAPAPLPLQGAHMLVDEGSSTFDFGDVARDLFKAVVTRISAPNPSPVIPDYGPVYGYGAQPVALNLPALGGAGARSLLNALGGGAVAAAGTAVVRAGGKFITAAGRVITRKRAVALAKVLGIQGAATALGIGAVELAEAVLADKAKSGRGKGISAAQLRTTRRTMRTVERMHRQIAGYCRDAGVRTTRVVRVAGGKRCR